jgi:hypothetical protein
MTGRGPRVIGSRGERRRGAGWLGLWWAESGCYAREREGGKVGRAGKREGRKGKRIFFFFSSNQNHSNEFKPKFEFNQTKKIMLQHEMHKQVSKPYICFYLSKILFSLYYS